MPSSPKRRPHRDVLDDLLGAPTDPPAPPAPAPAPAPAPSPSDIAPNRPHPTARPRPTARSAAAAQPRPAVRAAAPAVQRFTINLPAALIDRARDAVYHSPGLTLAALAAAALNREIDRLERQHGQPFPARPGPLRTGRPVQ